MKWVSVKYGLPEDCDNLDFYDDGRLRFVSVLAVIDGYVKETNRLKVEKVGNDYLDEQFTNGWIWGNNSKSVTHWMPLPEPPK